MKTDYTQLDTAILACMTCDHKVTFSEILDKVGPMAREFHRDDHFRVIDRRLQALRKAGKLTWSGKLGWMAA